jgi:pimeloyl-ACP methyl ester carboxylesterase
MYTHSEGRSFAARVAILLVTLTLVASACVDTVDSDFAEGVNGTDGEQSDGGESTGSGGDPDGTGSAAAQPDGADGVTGEAGDGQGADGALPAGALADPASLASSEEVPCSFDEPVPLPVSPVCYSITVPEDWSAPQSGRQVIIQAAVFPAQGEAEPEGDALIYLDGGPGGYTLGSLSFTYPNLIEPYLGSRDYVVFDQRGVGETEPALDCPELVEVALADIGGELDPDTAATTNLESIDACRDRLATSGIDLAAYNSVASANDVEAIRQLLGYEQFNIVSISYGTRLAQSYMRMYPDASRSVVLDSVFPTEANLWSTFNTGAIRAFEQMFAGCAASAECSAQYPNLRERFFELVEQLDRQPAQVEYQNQLTGDIVPGVVDGGDLLSMVFGALYDRGRFAIVPEMVENGLAGDYSAIEFLGSVQVTNLRFVSFGQRLSVECNEEIPFESIEELEANTPTEPPYDRLADLDNGLTLFDLCERWPADVAPEVESELVVSDIPTLILAGQYDPITPPAGADTVAAGLSNHYSFLLPHEGHGIVPTACGVELVNAFLADPTAEPDSSCIAESPEPVWVAPEAGPVNLIEFEVDGLVSVAGVRPETWIDAGNGAFIRQQTVLDPTGVLIQPTNGLPGETLIAILSNQIGIEFEPGDPIEVDGVAWNSFSSVAGSEQAARAGFKPGVDGVFVMLIADPAEIDDLYAELFQPVATAARSN